MAPIKSTQGSKKSSKSTVYRAVEDRLLSQVAEKLKSKQGVPKMPRGPAPAPKLAPFAGVSSLDVAPVSIGNTVRSVKQIVRPALNGVRVIGRDYVMAIGGTGTTYNGWTLQGGMALSPIALNASGLRGFFQTYERFKWVRCNAHYITSSPTSLAGDILLVYHSNHGGPKVDHSSSNFLSYALSTDSALIGPQWTNHSVQIIEGARDWFGTDVLNAEDVAHQADGELLVYTKNTTNGTSPDSPGYLLVDYEIHFERRMLNPRVQTLPSSLFKWFPTGFHINTAPAQFEIVSFDMGIGTATYAGTNPTQPVGVVAGDIFQVVFDTTNITIAGGISMTNVFSINIGNSGNAGAGTYITFPITNGTTLYAVAGSVAGNGSYALYPNYDSVFSGNTVRYTAASAGLTIACPLIITCVGSVNAAFTQANIG